MGSKVMPEAEVEVMQPQDKDCLEQPEVRRGKEKILSSISTECITLPTSWV